MIKRFLQGFIWCIIKIIKFLSLIPTAYQSMRKRKYCPPIENGILNIPAGILAKKIASQELTSENVVRTYIARVNEVNPIINAVVQDRFELAINEAKETDKYIQTSNLTVAQILSKKPLLGVPCTVKESIALSGMSHNAGSKVAKRDKAKKDADVVRLIKEAGAIPLLTSNTPEMCMNWVTENKVTGRTNNPYDTRRTCGGSSGGEASLLATGASVIGIGSDICGSLRLPPHFCGIWGHKPTHKRVSIEGHFPDCKNREVWTKCFILGPMSRYAVDLPLLLNIVSGDESKVLKLNEPVDLKKIKIFYMENDGGSILTSKVDPEIVKEMKKVVKHFEDKYSVKAEKINFKSMKNSIPLAVITLFNIDQIDTLFSEGVSFWRELLKFFVGCANVSLTGFLYEIAKRIIPGLTPKKTMSQLYISIDKLREEIDGTLGDNGIFLYPTFPNTALYHGTFLSQAFDTSYMAIFNSLGNPVTNCPIGLSSKGLPIGIQVVGKTNCDRVTLNVALEIERAFGGWQPPPFKKKTSS